MPPLTRWFLKAALLYLVMALFVGTLLMLRGVLDLPPLIGALSPVYFHRWGLLLFHKGLPLHPLLWRLLPLHSECVFIGWTTKLALGVAFWILPRFRTEPERGNVTLVWVAFACLNLGVGLIGVGAMMATSGWALLVGRLAETGAVLAFALQAWPRIRPFAH